MAIISKVKTIREETPRDSNVSISIQEWDYKMASPWGGIKKFKVWEVIESGGGEVDYRKDYETKEDAEANFERRAPAFLKNCAGLMR
jgi:hypothetical protein